MIWDDFVCDVCGLPFVNEQDWDNRHWGQEGEEYHEQCCPDCKENIDVE